MIRQVFLIFVIACSLTAQLSHQEAAERMKDTGMQELSSYTMLRELTTKVGHRFSGSAGYENALRWGLEQLKKIGVDTAWLEPVMIPHWERGDREEALMHSKNKMSSLSICALGGSVATPPNGITAQVVEVHSLEEALRLGEKAQGKIIFFNRPFDKRVVNTFEAYGGAVDQRGRGAVTAASVGAVGVLVRSMTTTTDDYPHTGAMRYYDSIPKIPAAAVSTLSADRLSEALRNDPALSVRMTMNCRSYPDVQSYNVIGQITGSEHPGDIVLIGTHLDSWDMGTGAHDNGAGIVHSIDALRLMTTLGQKPKRSVRCVLFANEENGIRGARAYAVKARQSAEKHIAAIESDEGGFTPRGFGVTGDSVQFAQILSYKRVLSVVGADRITAAGGGVDIDQLKTPGTALIGFTPDNQRYFDLHHSDRDTFDTVHPRELQLGSIAVATLAWCLAQDGI